MIIVVIIITWGAGISLLGLIAAFSSTLGAAIIISSSIIGGFYIGSEMTYSADVDTIVFTPICDQIITIKEDNHNAKGSCKLSAGEHNVTGGEPIVLQARIKKCKGWRSHFCPSCSIKCSTEYK